MDRKEFDNLPKDKQDIIFSDMCDLIEIVYNYPAEIDDLKCFAEWQSHLGCFGNELNNLFTGIYPCDKLDNIKSKEELYDLLKLSDRALELVIFWNRAVKNMIKIYE